MEVEARFAKTGRITVQRFRWQGRQHSVTSHGRQWEAADGRHLLVMTTDERVFELVYERASGTWRMARGPAEKPAAV